MQHPRQPGTQKAIGHEHRHDQHQRQPGQPARQFQDQHDPRDRGPHVVGMREHLGAHAQEIGVQDDVAGDDHRPQRQEPVGQRKRPAVARRRDPGRRQRQRRARHQRPAEGRDMLARVGARLDQVARRPHRQQLPARQRQRRASQRGQDALGQAERLLAPLGQATRGEQHEAQRQTAADMEKPVDPGFQRIDVHDEDMKAGVEHAKRRHRMAQRPAEHPLVRGDHLVVHALGDAGGAAGRCRIVCHHGLSSL